MSRENLDGVDVTRIRKGLYIVNGWEVEDVKGTSGWRLTAPGVTKWTGTLAQARRWIRENGDRHHPGR